MNENVIKEFRRIYKVFMVEGAKFYFPFDILECPCTAKSIPPSLIYYTDMDEHSHYSGFVHFYIDDYKFESVWNHRY